MNLIFVRTYKFDFSKKANNLFVQFCVIISVPSEVNLMKKRNFTGSILGNNLHTSEFNFIKKKTETLLTRFSITIYITSEFNFRKN